MKKSTKLLLPAIVLAILAAVSLLLAFVGGYQNIDIAGTHQRVQPSEFDRLYQPSELKADLDLLAKTLEEVHPDLYAYTPKSSFAQKKESTEKELESPISRIDFYLKVAPLVAMLNEGHTKIYPPYEEYYHFVGQGGLVFPFDLSLRENKVFVAANYSQNSLITTDSELLSINGIPTAEIVGRLLSLASGEKLQGKLGYLEEFFSHMLWLTYKFENEYEIEFISKLDGKHYTRTIAGVTHSTIQAKKKAESKEKDQTYYTYSSLPDQKIGIVDLRQFVDLDRFKEFLKETFTKIQEEGITDLIIDLRENGGGFTELLDPLFSYITDEPVVGGLNFEVKVSKEIKNYYRSTLKWYVKWFPVQYIHPTWRKIWNTPEGGIVVIRRDPEKPKDNPLRFKGQVYLLIGPKTYSTAQGFAAAVQDYKLGTLIGEETGGTACSFGEWYPFDLPHTRLWVFVSTKRVPRPSKTCDDRGVVPDYEVNQSEKDLEKGIDSVMEFTEKLIRVKRSAT